MATATTSSMAALVDRSTPEHFYRVSSSVVDEDQVVAANAEVWVLNQQLEACSVSSYRDSPMCLGTNASKATSATRADPGG